MTVMTMTTMTMMVTTMMTVHYDGSNNSYGENNGTQREKDKVGKKFGNFIFVIR